MFPDLERFGAVRPSQEASLEACGKRAAAGGSLLVFIHRISLEVLTGCEVFQAGSTSGDRG